MGIKLLQEGRDCNQHVGIAYDSTYVTYSNGNILSVRQDKNVLFC